MMTVTVLMITNSKLVNSELMTSYHTLICNSDSENKTMLRSILGYRELVTSTQLVLEQQVESASLIYSQRTFHIPLTRSILGDA